MYFMEIHDFKYSDRATPPFPISVLYAGPRLLLYEREILLVLN